MSNLNDSSSVNPAQNGSDSLIPFESATLPVRGRFVRLDKSLADIFAKTTYPDTVAHALVEAAALTTLLGSLLKFEGVFTLQIKGDGPITMLVCDMTSEGDLRATAQYNQSLLPNYVPNLTTQQLFGTGHIAFTIDQGPNTERYQGIVALADTSLTDSARQYFEQSEQIETFVSVTIGKLIESGKAERFCAAGLLLQRMPDQDQKRQKLDIDIHEEQDGWKRLTLFAESAKQAELLDFHLPAYDLLYRLFHEDGVQVAPQRLIRHKCRCSEQKIRSVLERFQPDQLSDMYTPQGDISAVCQFCGHDYRFKPDTLSFPKQ